MKKILSLLGSLSLITTTSSTVIACMSGNGENETDNSSEVLKLIEDFKVDLQLITDDFWKLQTDRFFEVVDYTNTVYAFLNEKTITNLVDSNLGEPIKGDKLDKSQKQYLTSDITKILQLDLMKKYFEEHIDHQKYALIIEEISFFNGFEPDWTSLEINYTNDSFLNSSSKASYFNSYVSMDLNMSFTYLDSNNMLSEYSLMQKFIFTLTSDEILMNSIVDLQKNITNEYYLKGGEYSWLDNSHFNYDINDDLANIFKPTDQEFAQIYSTKSNFSNDLIQFIKTNYFVNMNSVPLTFLSDNFFKSFTAIDNISASNSRHTLNWSTPFGKGIYNAIFSDLTHNDTSFLFGKDGSQINAQLYNYLKDDYLKFYNGHNSTNKARLTKMESESNLKLIPNKQSAFDNSIKTGKVVISDLNIDFGESYYHPINDITLKISIAISNNETKEERENHNQSYLFGAMYHNLELGIQTFQDVFDIQPRENNNDLPMARFTGNGIASSGELDNIWNIMDVSSTGKISELNHSLSLSKSNSTKYRDTIFEQGNQIIYEWWGSGNNTIFEKTDKGIIISEISGSGDLSLIWNFSLTFINVTFRIPDLWQTINNTVFERV